MSAERLRATAADMRAKAEAATPGPWEFDTNGCCIGSVPMTNQRDENDESLYFILERPQMRPGNFLYVQAMHPAVALAVADWLDKCADASAFDPPTSPGPTLALAVCDAWEAKS